MIFKRISGFHWRDDQKKIILSDLERIKSLRQYVQSGQARLKKLKGLKNFYKKEIKQEEDYLAAAKKEITRLEQAIEKMTFKND